MSIFYRFTILLFLGAVAWSAKARSTFVSSHAADLLSPQFNDNFGRGERAVYIVLMFSFWYNLVAWIVLMLNSSVLMVYLGLIDLSIAATMIPVVYWQSTYIPHSKGTCQNAVSWQVSNSTNESWFSVLARLHNPEDPDPEGYCATYVDNWIFAIIVIIIFSFLAFSNILTGSRDQSFTLGRCIRPWSIDLTQRDDVLQPGREDKMLALPSPDL
ncbi:hypothetical protein O988_06698 [Pseudogymnoascus sp. VKM F-3808]|nr:hypothetical protein O988_06698 [Pseudogymnoascus sp. VKM F-3808]